MVKLRSSYTFTLLPRAPYNFGLTVQRPAGWDLFIPKEIYDSGTLWTALHIGDLLTGLKLSSTGTTDSPRILVTVYSKDRLLSDQRHTVKETLASKLGVADDLKEFYSMAKKDEILRHTIEDLYGMHDTQSSSLFDATILAICLQMVPLKRSNQMNCILNKYGEVAEFNRRAIQVWPLPKVIAKLKERQLWKECNLGFRARYLLQVARVLQSGSFPTLEELAQLSQESAKKKLIELPGIGDYSSDIINPHGGFPIDVWSVEVFGKLFFGRRLGNPRKAIEKVKEEGIRRWGRWSWMAFYYVANDLQNLSSKLRIKLRLQ